MKVTPVKLLCFNLLVHKILIHIIIIVTLAITLTPVVMFVCACLNTYENSDLIATTCVIILVIMIFMMDVLGKMFRVKLDLPEWKADEDIARHLLKLVSKYYMYA